MENETLKEYYLQQLRLMCPIMPEDQPDNTKLVILQKRTSRLIEMLLLFDRLSTEEIPVIQKTILRYISTENMSRKERQRIINAWVNWTTFLFEISPFRGLITQFLQYHHRQMHDLEQLTGSETPENTELQTD